MGGVTFCTITILLLLNQSTAEVVAVVAGLAPVGARFFAAVARFFAAVAALWGAFAADAADAADAGNNHYKHTRDEALCSDTRTPKKEHYCNFAKECPPPTLTQLPV